MSSNSSPGAAGLASRRAVGRRYAPVRWALRAVLWLLFAMWAVLLAVWLSLHWLILPHIEEWRGAIETRASLMLGAPVKIGAISAQSSRWVPSLELSDVRILDAEQRVALTLPRVFAALSARSVLALEPRFAQLLVDGASLDIRRDKNGRIRVAGLDVDSGSSAQDDDAAADWFFRQREFVIRAGTLRWIDEARDAPPLVLSNVELIVRNGLRAHDLRLDATPPEGWGERFSVRGRFTQALFDKAGDWRRWSGHVYADLPRVDLRELKRRATLPFDLSEGDGALRGWFDVKEGQPTKASVDLALRAVALRLDPNVEPLQFEQISGRVDAEKKDDRTSIAVQRFGFRTGDGLTWPESDMAIAWRQAGAGAVTGGDIEADRLDVGLMAEIATRVPLGTALRGLLADVRPRGVVTGLRTHWDGPLDAPTHYRVRGLMSDLALTGRPSPQAADAIGRPGVQNATVQLDASDTGGQAQVTVRAGRIDLPGVLADPALALDRLDAHLTWKIDAAAAGAAPNVSVKVGPASFANADAKGELSATWRTGRGTGVGRGGRYPGELELDGRIVDAAAARLGRYLPLGLPEGVRSYLGRAVRAGTISNATFRVRGDLSDFPFHDPKVARDAEFHFAARVDGVTFAYAPGDPATPATSGASAEAWPPLTAASGEIVVDRNALELHDVKARILDVEWSGLQGRIAEMGSKGRLDIDGTGRGPLSAMLRFVETTPVGRWTGRALSAATATGPAELKLALNVPIAHVSDTTVKGTLTLVGNDVRMTSDTPLLGAAKARIDFSNKGFTVGAGSARVLGGELAFEGGTSAGLNGGDTQRFNGRGTFSAEALRQATELGTVARFATFASGQSTYRASLSFVGGRPHVSVASNLVGMGIDLPAPFAKTAATALPLRIRSAPVEALPGAPAEAANTTHDVLQVDFGGMVQAQFLRESIGDTGRVVRGAIRVVDTRPATSDRAPVEPTPLDPIEALSLPASGVAANVSVKKLDVDVWEGVLARFQGDPAPARGVAPTATHTPPPLVFDSSGGAGYVPTTIALRVGELELGSRRLANVTAGLSLQGELWRANVDADELAGYVEYRPARRGAVGAGRVFARLSRLSLPKGEAERVESLLDEQPASIPALDIVVEDFELRGKRLGRLEVEAINRTGGSRESVREWQLSKLNLTMPEAQFAATGTWGGTAAAGAPAGTRHAAMNFVLTLADSGALLERLGMGRVVKGGKGSLTGDVSWPGSPFSPDYAKMTGQVKVAIDSGQFLKAGPGAARLLGVLSLQSLPRRLLLDFRDVFAEGFAFDNVVGDVKIAKGLASTNNLRMRGVAAAVLMEGSADIVHETEDLRVVVVPEINAGTASLAFAVINPAIGLGTFLAQYFLRKPLMAASTREFHITGPWDDPKVDRVDRGLFGDASPAGTASPGADPSPAVTR
ncbi:MAG: YhdP family protein [Caldimonas sp.]